MTPATPSSPDLEAPRLHVAPGPHLVSGGRSTRGMMVDVLVGLAPVLAAAVLVFREWALLQLALCLVSCALFETLFARLRGRGLRGRGLRGREASLTDGSALVTGAILGLSLPWSAPWYVAVVASAVAIGIGKAAYGGLGQNVFNPAMVGRAFVMVSFASVMGAASYVRPGADLSIVTQATPLTAAKEAAGAADIPGLWPMFLGVTNGSLGETSALACLLGGVWLCWRRSAAWRIPAGVFAGAAAAAAVAVLANPASPLGVPHHLLAGSLAFGAFFIATDPVTSPLSHRGQWLFGLGIGVLVITIRMLSNYPEGVVFAVLLMNAAVPLIDRATIPEPLGGIPSADREAAS